MNKQEAIEILKDERRVYIVDGRERELDRALDMAIEALSAERTGEWIDTAEGTFCSECDYKTNEYHNFCPNCGADMRGDNK